MALPPSLRFGAPWLSVWGKAIKLAATWAWRIRAAFASFGAPEFRA
jgi:hypothetical protein